MLFEIDQSGELLTPTINNVGGGVDKVNPSLTSSDLFSLDDLDICFSSIPSENNEYEMITKDNMNASSDNNHHQLQDELFPTINFSDFREFDKTDLSIDDLQIDKYISQSSFSSTPIDTSPLSNDSISNNENSSSSAFPWIGEECTVESINTEDMMVPPSPPISSSSSSPSSSSKRSTKITTLERKLRKKDQNKTAAEKYRLKKRSERNELIHRHVELKNQNRELKHEFENLSFRLEQFKQLFVDVLQIEIPSK